MTAQKQSNQLLSYQEVCKLTQLSQATICSGTVNLAT